MWGEFGVERRCHGFRDTPRAAVETTAPETAGRAGEGKSIGRDRIVSGHAPLRRGPALLLADVEDGERCTGRTAFGDKCGLAKIDDAEILPSARPAQTAGQD